MSRAPIDAVLDTVEWTPTGAKDSGGATPYATHSGELEIFGEKLRCYRLSDGRAVIDADDLRKFFKGAI